MGALGAGAPMKFEWNTHKLMSYFALKYFKISINIGIRASIYQIIFDPTPLFIWEDFYVNTL